MGVWEDCKSSNNMEKREITDCTNTNDLTEYQVAELAKYYTPILTTQTMNITNLLKQIEGVFIQPDLYITVGKAYGYPYFPPMKYVGSIIRVNKRPVDKSGDVILPMTRRAKNFLIGRWYIEAGWPVAISRTQLMWKDKYDAPRFEWAPSITFYFFGYMIRLMPKADEKYYEQVLWWFYYSNRNIDKAEETWPWRDMNGKSTWNNNYTL